MASKPRLVTTPPSAPIERDGGLITGIGRIDEDVVKVAYRRWAPVYDHTFGRVSTEGRKHAVRELNKGTGSILEVGVGTGLALGDYSSHLQITGIDLSPEMLEKARERVKTENLKHVRALHEMDAGDLQFPDASFDTVVAMYVVTVVPEPEKVMGELCRVTKPGGQVMLVNHFSQVEGVRGWVERRMAPFAEVIGWRPVFDVSRVMVCDELELVERQSLKPFGIFTMMRFAKSSAGRMTADAAE